MRQSVVIDTNVIVSAILSPLGKPAEIYRAFLNESAITLFYNAEILEEYKDVLCRPRLKLSAADIAKFYAALTRDGVIFTPDSSDIDLPDEDDRIFYDTAKGCNAILITGNTKHYPREPFILTPAEFVEDYVITF